MFNSKGKQAKKEIGARKKAEERLKSMEASGELKDKDYKKLKATLDDYTKRMEGYHH